MEVLVNRMNSLPGPVLHFDFTFGRLDPFFHRPSLMVERFEVFLWILLAIHQVCQQHLYLSGFQFDSHKS